MAALEYANKLQRSSLRIQRASVSRPLLVVAHLGPRSYLWPTQACAGSRLTTQRQASACPHLGSRRRSVRGRQLVVRSVAMVNVDFASPSLLLGTALIGCGVLLLNLRNFQNKVSRDADIVVAAMVSIVGSTLIFQGWRLDPLLLLCQALTTSVAFWYGLETFRLRSKEADLAPPPPQLPPGGGPEPPTLDEAQQAAQSMQQYYQQGGMGGFPGPGMPYLPSGSDSYYPWGGARDAAASTLGRGPYNAPYVETIQYDYYGNPILPQEPAYNGTGAYNSYNPVAYGSSGGDPYGPGSPPGEVSYGGNYPSVGPSVQTAYDTPGTTGSPSPSYSGPPGPDSAYMAQATSPSPSPPLRPAPSLSPPPQQPPPPGGPFPPSVPNVSANGVGLGAGREPQYGTTYSNSSDAALAMGVVYNWAGQSAWAEVPSEVPSEARGLGHGTGSLGPAGSVIAQPGRVDLFEKVDDWE